MTRLTPFMLRLWSDCSLPGRKGVFEKAMGDNLGLVVAAIVAVVAYGPAAIRHAEAVNCRKSDPCHSLRHLLRLGKRARGLYAVQPRLDVQRIDYAKLLVCPADHKRRPIGDWASVTASNNSCEIVTPGLRFGESNAVFCAARFIGRGLCERRSARRLWQKREAEPTLVKTTRRASF